MVGDSLIHYINFRALAGALGSFERLRITSSSQSTQSRELYGKAWSIPSLNIHVSIFQLSVQRKTKKEELHNDKTKTGKGSLSQSKDPPQRHQTFLACGTLSPPNNFGLATPLDSIHALVWILYVLQLIVTDISYPGLFALKKFQAKVSSL